MRDVTNTKALFLLISVVSCRSAASTIEVNIAVTPSEDVHYVLRDPSAFATFTCITNGSDLIAWWVNGTSSTDNSIRGRGVTTTPSLETVDPGIFLSTLNIRSDIANDNTVIQCGVVVNSDELVIVNSTPVLLRVRDIPGPPSNTVIESSDGLKRILIWDAQATDILYYRVCYNLTANSLECVNVTKREFTFHNVGVNLLFTVSGVNVVGEGQTSSALHKACEGMML